ncbi:hypothetical protein PM082_024181 [Marasmius tenuissimus]|nr:hypothetical protein PM082_024181 [Marasmius tenuissimus]
MPAGLSLVLFLLSFSSLLSFSAAQGEGTAKCADSGLDWYVGGAGETPCRTYERLRQICNSNYRVGKLNPNTPPDFCDEQVASCCCNSVSFALSMLCLTCQRGVGSSGIGIDAGKGAYQMYLNAGRPNNQFCSPQVNKTLPGDIQNAVCNNNIKIYDGLYNLFWGDGTWFYVYTSQTLTKDQNANPDTVLGKCSSPKPPTTTSTSTSTSSTPKTVPTTTSTPTTSTSTPSKQDSTTTEIRENVSTSSSSNSADTSSSSASSSSAVAHFVGTGLASFSSAAPSSTESGADAGTSDHSGTETESGDSASSNHLGSGAIAGIAIGCLALITIVIIALLYCRRRRYAAQLSRSQPIYPTAPGEVGSPYSDSRTGLNAQATLPSHPPSPTPQPQPLILPLREKDPRQLAETTTSPYSDDDGMTNSDRPTSEAYTTTTATDMLWMERHVDAGPIRSSMLNRAPSGRLPPAYGDLVREAGMSSAPPVPLLEVGYGQEQDQGEGPSTSRV